jgi:aminoglycoside 6'-N-acetyltransferase I
MTIVDLLLNDESHIDQTAEILVQAFAHYPDTWDTFEQARTEVLESFQPNRLSRVALDEQGNVIGWVGGIPQYDGNVFELHPLAVKPSHHRQGIGRALVADLEVQARMRGAITVILGTDDEIDGTNLYGRDLYPDIAEKISGIRNIHNHPYEFYQKCGYVIYGILPDADGFGRPDILMAKRVGNVRRSDDAQR